MLDWYLMLWEGLMLGGRSDDAGQPAPRCTWSCGRDTRACGHEGALAVLSPLRWQQGARVTFSAAEGSPWRDLRKPADPPLLGSGLRAPAGPGGPVLTVKLSRSKS